LGFATPEVGVVWPALLFVIVAVFVLEVRLGGLASLLNPPGELLVRLGALYTPAIMSGEYWRLLSAGLLHVGVLHIVFNLMALSQLAPAIEEEIGASRFMVLATVTQLGCTLASYSLRAFAFSAGASGIAFGLIGFGLAYSRRQRTSHGRMLSDIYLKWAVYGFFFGMMIGADNLGHLGGLVAGVAFGRLIPADKHTPKPAVVLFWRILAGACLAAWAYALFSMWRSIAG
jgi:rhomboid protease GluP